MPCGRLPETTTTSPSPTVAAMARARRLASSAEVLGPGSLMSVFVPRTSSTTFRFVRVSPSTVIASTSMPSLWSMRAIFSPVPPARIA